MFLHRIPGYFQGSRSQNKFQAFQGFQGAVGTLLKWKVNKNVYYPLTQSVQIELYRLYSHFKNQKYQIHFKMLYSMCSGKSFHKNMRIFKDWKPQ